MLLSPTDRSRFKILYSEHTHLELAHVFNSNVKDVIATAKQLGIFDEKRRDNDIARQKSTNL